MRPRIQGNGTAVPWPAAFSFKTSGGAATPTPAATAAPTATSTPKPTTTPIPGVTVDRTKLMVGDKMTSTSATRGRLWSCQTTFTGGGASTKGPWFNSDGTTWDMTKKAEVDGEVSWPHILTVTVQGDKRVFSGNGLPDHTTGIYPISQSDDAYQYDRNPNSISAQTVVLELPANPTVNTSAQCAGGEVGVLLTGSRVFNAFDAGGRDAVAWEVQDHCAGHPEMTGAYHYHSITQCVAEIAVVGHSSLRGYALDGFGLYGHHGEDGMELTNDHLDECHGHTHEIDWDGQKKSMYHYHATWMFPYTVGCFRGTAVKPSTGGGGGTSPSATPGASASPAPSGTPMPSGTVPAGCPTPPAPGSPPPAGTPVPGCPPPPPPQMRAR